MRRYLMTPAAGRYRLVTLLIGLVAFSVLSTALVQLAISHRSGKQTLTETTLKLNYNQAAKISDTIETLFESMQESLRTTAELLAEHEPHGSMQEHLELIHETNSYFNSVLWMDETGLIRDIAPASVGLEGERIELPIVMAALEARKPHVSEPAVGPTGRLLVMVSEPFYDDSGVYLGLIGGTIYLQENNILNKILGYNPVGVDGSYFYVVDGTGRLLFHPNPARIGVDVSANPVVGRLLRGEQGSMRTVNTLGVPMLAGFRPVGGTGWGVVQQTPVEAVAVQIRDNTRSIALGLLVPFLVVLLVSVLLARMLAKPFIRLADIVKQLSAGQAVDVPEDRRRWSREAELLARTVMLTSDTLQRRRRQLEHAAATDPLTGMGNRRAFQHDLETMMREHDRFSLIVLDIDHFKSINDTFGHQAGDETIKEVAASIAASIRSTDSCSRYGGEEFVILLPDTSASKAFRAAEKLRRTIEATVRGIGRPVTVSLGVAEYPLHADDPDELFDLADKALYLSKARGRNRTTVADSRRNT